MENRYQFSQIEAEMQSFWQQQGIYDFQPNAEQENFVIDTPPPTVSGKLHIGHVFSYTHADIIARYQRMSGKNVFYPMGFDDNGLPTEKFVTKKRNLRLNELSREQFVAICLEECALAEKDFEGLWRKLGLSIDWRQTYATVSNKVSRVSQYSFIELFHKGLVSRKAEPYLYCTTCQTSVAQAELEWQEKVGKFNTLKFSSSSGHELPIATTRPELLPACVAVFFHPDDPRYQHLSGQQAITPLFGKQVPILPDEQVDPAKGTGLVMCCTFGDQTDVAWYKKHRLPFIQAIDIYGKMSASCGSLAGLKLEEARALVLEQLQVAGLLLEQKEISHGSNLHERCGKGIEYQIIKQWFIKIIDHKQQFLDLGAQIEWQPAHMHNRYIDWVSNLSWDWCISRQRLFGIPIPAWNCDNCQYTYVPTLEQLPVNPLNHNLVIPPCPSCGQVLQPEKDVLDTWATSSLTPLIVANWPDNFDQTLFPSSIRPQAHDIIRTWAFYTIVKSFYHTGLQPWQKLVISGHVLAGKEKISKSKENASNAPEQLLKTYSADAVRFWAGSARLGIDTLFDESKLKAGLRCSTKLWNAMRFIKQNLAAVTMQPQAPESPDELSCWLLQHLRQTQELYHRHFANNDFALALGATESFFWQIFCDNYLELIKDLLFNPQNYSAAALNNANYCLYQAGLAVLQLYAPFMPFVCESLYLEFFRPSQSSKSLHLSQFTALLPGVELHEGFQVWELLLPVIEAVRRIKSEQNLSLKTSIASLNIACPANLDGAKFKAQSNLLAGVTRAENIKFFVSATAVPTSLSSLEDKLTINTAIGFEDARE